MYKRQVLSALARSELEHLSVYTEVMQDAVVELIDAGKVACASGTALTISPSARELSLIHICKAPPGFFSSKWYTN